MSYINTRYIASRCGAILPGSCLIFRTDQLTKACWIENTKFHYTQNKSLPLDRFLNHLHDVHVVALMKMSRRVQRLMCVTCSARDFIFALLAKKTKGKEPSHAEPNVRKSSLININERVSYTPAKYLHNFVRNSHLMFPFFESLSS